jgi:threonyl-tRNA synthetase
LVPVIENGFFYDFALSVRLPEDLAAIEKRMAELAKRDIPVTFVKCWGAMRRLSFFSPIGEKYKAELIEAIPGGSGVVALPRRRFCRPLPWAARPFYWQAQGLSS